jgi:hypothetical protein
VGTVVAFVVISNGSSSLQPFKTAVVYSFAKYQEMYIFIKFF